MVLSATILIQYHIRKWLKCIREERKIVQEQEARASKMSPKRKITKKGRLSGFIGSNVRVNRRTIVYNGDQINGVCEDIQKKESFKIKQSGFRPKNSFKRSNF